MSYDMLAILLLLVGFALIVAEIFIPSGGMISVLCVVCFIASIWCAYKAWYVAAPAYWWTYLASIVVLIPSFVVGVFRMLSTTRLGDRILLTAPSLEEVTPYQDESAHLAEFVGRQGTALTLLTPGGLVQVDSERLHAFSEGILIQRGATVEIVAVRGTRVLVRPVSSGALSGHVQNGDSETAAADALSPPPGSAPLDFDVPQS